MKASKKRLLLGVTGGIAAYKIPHLVRLFITQNWDVQVIATPDAFQFVTPFTLSTLSKQTVLSDWKDTEGNWNNHVHLGTENDVFLIAPLTANTLSKMANGQCDNLLLATYLSATCPVWVAPAMDRDMWLHAATQRNIKQIEKDGVHIIPPAEGELASGLSGVGRMAEIDVLYQTIQDALA